MKNVLKSLAVATMILALPASNAFALPLVTISNGDISDLTVDPLSGSLSLYDSFRYLAFGRSSSFRQADTGYLWVYEDTASGIVGLGVVLDVKRIANTTTGNAQLSFTGAPDSAFVAHSDDTGEFNKTGLDSFVGTWKWIANNLDGGYIGGLQVPPADYWTIKVDLLSSFGINNWLFLTGDLAAPTTIQLDMTKSLYVSDPPARVPEPSAFLLLGAGLLGLGLLRKRSRLN